MNTFCQLAADRLMPLEPVVLNNIHIEEPSGNI